MSTQKLDPLYEAWYRLRSAQLEFNNAKVAFEKVYDSYKQTNHPSVSSIIRSATDDFITDMGGGPISIKPLDDEPVSSKIPGGRLGAITMAINGNPVNAATLVSQFPDETIDSLGQKLCVLFTNYKVLDRVGRGLYVRGTGVNRTT